MSLVPGARLGPYEIVSPLGAGGMGEVYRACDTRLGRDVAIKVLPQHLSANADVRARFEREARTVSSLNHPNICTLFDVGREGETDYLVMELIEGETLATRLARGALPVADVLRLGAQVADALDRAHRAGVIHRDLKPGNVMLTRSGAKLMDFGLARATGLAGPASASGVTGHPARPGPALTQSPTVAGPLTAEGTIVGTFQYMSPEQLEGKEADARSDIWALGCVLYEMASGRRAFEGASQASLIGAIMNAAPRPLGEITPVLPPTLDRLVRQCLARDPEDRWQSARDLARELRAIDGAPGGTSGSAAVAAPARPRGRAWPARLAVAFGVLGLAAAAFAFWEARSHESSPVALDLPCPPDLRLHYYWSSSVISPDGSHVVAVAARGGGRNQLWTWSLASADPTPVADTELPTFPAWSPDSRSIAFASAIDRALYRVPLAGGRPTRLCDMVDGRGVSWGRKSVIAFAPTASGPIWAIPAGGGAPRQVTELDRSRHEVGHRFPVFLPDGEHFLYAVLPGGPRGYTIRVGSLGSMTAKTLLEAESVPVYAAPGYLVFAQGGKVTAQRFDLGRLELTGERIAIADQPVLAEMDAEPVASASHDGRLAFPVVTQPDSRLEWFSRSGAQLGTLALPPGDWVARTLSHDQRFAIATMNQDLWQVDLERAVATRLTRAGHRATAAWSADDRRIAICEADRDSLPFALVQAGGNGGADSVATPAAAFREVVDWAPDGRTLLVALLGRFDAPGEGTNWDLWIVPTGDGTPTAYVVTPAHERTAWISPDGTRAMWAARIEGQTELWIDSYPVPGHRVQILVGERELFFKAQWGRDGRDVIYADSKGDLNSVPLAIAGDAVRPGKPVRLFHLPEGTTAIASRDGERFLVSHPTGASPKPVLRIVTHWTETLRK